MRQYRGPDGGPMVGRRQEFGQLAISADSRASSAVAGGSLLLSSERDAGLALAWLPAIC
jgi:hypothetical protein